MGELHMANYDFTQLSQALTQALAAAVEALPIDAGDPFLVLVAGRYCDASAEALRTGVERGRARDAVRGSLLLEPSRLLQPFADVQDREAISSLIIALDGVRGWATGCAVARSYIRSGRKRWAILCALEGPDEIDTIRACSFWTDDAAGVGVHCGPVQQLMRDDW